VLLPRSAATLASMAQHTPHARIISEAARSVLGPLGLNQWGRTRLWIDDQRWRLGLAEFEAGSLTRGCSLRVGAMWLWSHHGGFRFDLERRLERFVFYRNKSQFEREAHRLAVRAAEAVVEQRNKFASVEGASNAIFDSLSRSTDIGALYDAAVAAGICGDVHRAMTLFARIAVEPRHTARDHALASDAAVLANDAANPAVFRLSIEHRVIESRRELRLPTLSDSRLFADLLAEPEDSRAG